MGGEEGRGQKAVKMVVVAVVALSLWRKEGKKKTMEEEGAYYSGSRPQANKSIPSSSSDDGTTDYY